MSMMKIGVDAQMLCRSLTGIERYAYEILREMIRQEPGNSFFLYAPRPIKADFSNSSNVIVRAANMQFLGAGTVCGQVQLPYWAGIDQPDLLWGPVHRLPRLLSNKIARVVTIHDLVWKHASETMRALSRLAEEIFVPDAIRLADMVVADSQSTADDIAAEFPRAKGRIRVVHLGATAFPEGDRIESLGKFGIEGPYVLFVGTLEPRKNLRRLLQAWASLDPLIRGQYKLVIAGGKGWGNEDLAALVRSLNLADSVRLTGYVSDLELATLYAHALFLAMPSLYEGFGLPLVEAMSFGVPVLTSTTSSLPEVAGEAGMLVDPASIASIGQGLLRLIADNELRSRLALRAKGSASRFSWERAAKDMVGIFEEAIYFRRGRKHFE